MFNNDEIADYTTDQCHPNGEGMFVMASNFHGAVMESWVQPRSGQLSRL